MLDVSTVTCTCVRVTDYSKDWPCSNQTVDIECAALFFVCLARV